MLRVSELCTLTWHDILLTHQHLHLHLGATKGDQHAQHPDYTLHSRILTQMLSHIHKLISPPDYYKVIPYTPHQLNQVLTQALSQVHYPIPTAAFCSWHSLRHGRAVDLSITGHTLPSLMSHGRWATQAATKLYLYFLSPKHWPSNIPTPAHQSLQ